MPWVWAALMPHPPILVPEVGRGRENEARETLKGLELLAEALRDRRPDALLVLSPHQPYAPGALFLNSAGRAAGTLAPFGAPSVTIGIACPGELRRAAADRLSALGARIREGSHPDLTSDQGTLVPLYFLRRAWGRDGENPPENLPPALLASPIGLTPDEALSLGERLALLDDGLRWGLVASGDLSHRLIPSAPSGYAPEAGRAFDDAVLEALRQGSAAPIFALKLKTIDEAGQCGLWSVLAMLGLMEALGGTARVLSYEGPFGVGYCTAAWDTPIPAPVRLARETVTRLLSGRPLPERGSDVCASPLWERTAACFVSIKTRQGALRGCIGTLAPSQATLDREIIENAVAAATRDPRFPPMTAEELEDVRLSVDVLSDSEPVEGVEQLDPRLWGVIVSKGWRRGVLLPDLEGVDTAEQQVEIAARKAGLGSLEGVALQRFGVTRYREQDAATGRLPVLS